MLQDRHIIICPVGLNGSGKGKVCKILSDSHGFISYSTSDVFRELTTARGLELTRENIGKTANEIRKEQGKDFASAYLSQSMDISKFNYVIDGCRQVEEILYLQNKYPDQVVVLKVYCDPHIRFDRMKARNRVGDPATFEAFVYADEVELGNVAAANAMNYKACFELARAEVTNNGTPEDLEAAVSEFLTSL